MWANGSRRQVSNMSKNSDGHDKVRDKHLDIWEKLGDPFNPMEISLERSV